MSFRSILMVLLVGAGFVSARAQVELAFRLEFAEAIELEPVPAVVTLENRGAQTLHAGRDYNLSFDVTDRNGLLVALRPGRAPFCPPKLAPGAVSVFTNDLQALYRMDPFKQYGVVARLQTPGRALVSPKLLLDIVPGIELATVEGVAPDGTPRRFSLREHNRERKSRLYLRVDDPDAGLCYGVFDLGRYVAMKTPEIRLDAEGLIHILHLTAPNAFVHSVFSSSGDLVAQQDHLGDATAVRLEPDTDSGFRVTGSGITPPRERMLDTLPTKPRL